QTRGPSRRFTRDRVISHSDVGEPARGKPFVGRESALQRMHALLKRADGRGAGMVVVSGEAGVGKTRLLEEFAREANRGGAAVLWGGTAARCNHLAYGPFAVALEGYAASRPEAEREELAQRYPALARFVPSLATSSEVSAPREDPREDHLQFLLAVVRLLTALGRAQPVVLVVGDLHDADPVGLDLL